jgi:hypothetical protein
MVSKAQSQIGELVVAPAVPATVQPARPRPSLGRSDTAATFISQLLAERAHLPPQRQRRRASPEGAVGAYSSGASIAVKRMPAGYRTSKLV